MRYILVTAIFIFFLSSCGPERQAIETAGTWETNTGSIALGEEEVEKPCLTWEEKVSFFQRLSWGLEWEPCKEEKKDFFIEATELWDFPSNYNIKKVGKLSSTQSVQMSSNAVGRIATIKVKEWETVKSGQVLATLSDNIWSYNINVEKASNAISRAKINYESQKIVLDKQVADAELLLARLWKNLVNLEKTNAQNIERNQNDSDNLNTEANLERTELSIMKIEQNINKLNQNIEKLEFDSENGKISNQETINWFRNRTLTEQNSLRLSLDDIIEFADEILWVTPENKDENEDFDRYLWAKDTVQRTVSEQSLRDLISFRNWEFEVFIPDEVSWMTEEELLSATLTWEKGYALVRTLLAELEKTFQNSLSSIGSLSEEQIDAYIAQINGYQSSTQGSYTGFISLKNQIESFLSTYENTELSTEKQIDLLRTDVEILKSDRDILLNDYAIQKKNLETSEKNLSLWIDATKTQWEDAIINLQNQIDSAELSYSNAKKTRTVSLKSLNNQITEAEISYKQAVKERSKLSVTAPISGTIAVVNVDLWQEVSNGMQLFNIQNTSKTEIVIWLTDKEIEQIKVWKKVAVRYDGNAVKWQIFSISDVADENLNYKTTVKLDKAIDKLGGIVEVYIPISSKNALVPLNIITVDSTGWQGFLTLYDQEKDEFRDLWVMLWNTYDDDIEVLKCENPKFLDDNEDGKQDKYVPCEIFEKSEIVTSNINNFDENKFKIVKK